MNQVAGWLVAAGLFGVVVTSALYAASPPAAVLPAGHPDLAAALSGAISGQVTVRAAGLVGIAGDVLFTAGALLLAARNADQSRRAAAGWAMIVLCGAVFTAVDCIAAFALVPAARLTGDGGAFAALKLVFDALFLAGTLATGMGMVLIFADRLCGPGRVIGWLGLLTGVGCLVGVAACTFGLPAGQLIGLSIAGSSLTGGLLGLTIARSAGTA